VDGKEMEHTEIIQTVSISLYEETRV
jgi:hypothetical protein